MVKKMPERSKFDLDEEMEYLDAFSGTKPNHNKMVERCLVEMVRDIKTIKWAVLDSLKDKKKQKELLKRVMSKE